MRPIEQIKRALDADSRSGISSMAPIGCESQGLIVRSWVAYSGAIAPEALQAVGLMAEDRRDVGLLAITSADRLYAEWTAAQRARESGLDHSRSHIERLLAGLGAAQGTVRDSSAFRTNRLAGRSLPALWHRCLRYRHRGTIFRHLRAL
jgi:pyruvate dehydrogenase E1 component